VKPASMPRRLVHQKTWRDSVPFDMLPFGVTIPATVPQSSEIPEGFMNYPVDLLLFSIVKYYNKHYNNLKRAIEINSTKVKLISVL
jgi:hypothetical protein